MELLLIPFLFVGGVALIYLGVQGVPTAPWLSRARAQTGNLVVERSESVAVEPAIGESAVEPAAKRDRLKNVRPVRIRPAENKETEPPPAVDGAALSDEGAIETIGPIKSSLNEASAPTQEKVDTGSDEEEDAVERLGPAPSFGEPDALLGQVLMEMSIVRNEIKDLRSHVEGLSARKPVVTRAPGGPRRRRLRRISGL